MARRVLGVIIERYQKEGVTIERALTSLVRDIVFTWLFMFTAIFAIAVIKYAIS